MTKLLAGKWRWIAVTIVIVLTILIVSVWWNFRARRLTDVPPASPSAEAPPVTSIATGLEIPWALDFLPDGSLVFTERPGRVRLIDANGRLLKESLLTISEVASRGEGGLLGIAVHPDFASNQFIYVYYTYQQQGGLANKVVRLRKDGNSLVDSKVIIDNIPGASIHDGGRIKFGPDRRLYITTGDASAADLAQDRSSLAGKILRIEDNGSIPADNPFPGSPVYSFGHRNPQGLTWDSQRRLWATEHGSSATDEVNLIQPGKNYGWPVIRGDASAPGMEVPVVHSGDDTWAPSGAAIWQRSLFFAGLRGQSLFELEIDNQRDVRRHFSRSFGRLRDVVIGPDGFIYLLTNNRDGRGVPSSEDDQIIRINPGRL